MGQASFLYKFKFKNWVHLKKILGNHSVGASDKSHDGGLGLSGKRKSEVERLGSGSSGSGSSSVTN